MTSCEINCQRVVAALAVHRSGQTCSIGVASLNRHASSEQSTDRCKSTLLRLSDAAMYVAKETGRNRTAVSAELVQRPRQNPSRFD